MGLLGGSSFLTVYRWSWPNLRGAVLRSAGKVPVSTLSACFKSIIADRTRPHHPARASPRNTSCGHPDSRRCRSRRWCVSHSGRLEWPSTAIPATQHPPWLRTINQDRREPHSLGRLRVHQASRAEWHGDPMKPEHQMRRAAAPVGTMNQSCINEPHGYTRAPRGIRSARLVRSGKARARKKHLAFPLSA